MYKQLLLFVAVIATVHALPSFKWRRSARSDSPAPQSSRLFDMTFLQNLPRFMFGPLKRSSQQPPEFVSLNPLDGRVNRLDSGYHSYEVLSASTGFKPAVKPLASNELTETFNDVYSSNDAFEDDDVIVIPFTKQRGATKFGDKWDNKKYPNAKNEQGVPAPPAPVAGGHDSTGSRPAATSRNNRPVKNLDKRFAFKVITDSEDDLETGDELPASLGTDETGSDFKVQFSDLHPIYVKPPKEFQPLIYPNREVDGPESLRTDSQATVRPLVTDEKQERPYKYPNGVSSWILGGSRPIQRTGFWESLTSDESLHGYRTASSQNGAATGKVELELNDNSLDRVDADHKPIKAADDLSRSPSEQDNLEFISLSEPKSRSDDDELQKSSKKAYLIGKLKQPLSKNVLLKRKLNLKPKRVKILSKANRLFDKSTKLN